MAKLETLVGVILALIFIYVLFVINPPQQPPFYSLIVTDASGHQWAVDYNLTVTDCQVMIESPSARCEVQPEGKLP